MDMADDSVIVNGLEVDDLRWVIGGFRWCVCMYICVGGCIIIWVWVAANGCGWLKIGVGGCRCDVFNYVTNKVQLHSCLRFAFPFLDFV